MTPNDYQVFKSTAHRNEPESYAIKGSDAVRRMDGWTDRRMDGWTDGGTDGRMEGRTDRRTDERTTDLLIFY